MKGGQWRRFALSVSPSRWPERDELATLVEDVRLFRQIVTGRTPSYGLGAEFRHERSDALPTKTKERRTR